MTAPLLEVRRLVKHFGAKGVVRAVDDVSFGIAAGETFGVVGESGCGKSTTARLVMRIMPPTTGEILFAGREVGDDRRAVRSFFRDVQMVFQDSYASLNPRLTVADSIAFAPRVNGLTARAALDRAHDLMARVGLDPVRFAGRYPHELSGGQRQRANIARALAVQPKLVILDEAVSALDKSVEAQVLNLLLDLKEEFGLTYMFISHDLHVVRFMADRVMVMYLGEIAEIGRSEDVFANPRHPYTQALLRSVPSVDPDNRTQEAPLTGDPPNPIAPPPGCRFHPRCVYAAPVCSTKVPGLNEAGAGHNAACHLLDPASGHPLAVAA